MRSKIIELGLIFIYTHTIYVFIIYMEYIEYDENLDMIVYGVYLHRLIISFLLCHMWRREFDKNCKYFSHAPCSFCSDDIIYYYSLYQPGISITCVSYVTLVPLLEKCVHVNIQAYKSRM